MGYITTLGPTALPRRRFVEPAPPAAPVGPISLAEELLRTTLADCPAFRTWVSAANATEALTSIYVDAIPAPAFGVDTYTRRELEALRPYALVWTAENDGFDRVVDSVSASGFRFHPSGNLMFSLLQDVPAEIAADPAAIGREFKNAVGLILNDLTDRFGGGGFLAAERITLVEGPFRSEINAQVTYGDMVGVELRVEWGGAS